MKTITIRAEDLPIRIEIEGYAKGYVAETRVKALELELEGFCIARHILPSLLKCANRAERTVKYRKDFTRSATYADYTPKEIAHVLCRDETTIKYYILFPNGRPHRPNKKQL